MVDLVFGSSSAHSDHMKCFQAAWPLLTAAVCARAAESIPTELFPPETKIVVSFSVRSLLDSPILKRLGGRDKFSTNFGAAMPLAAIDPVRDLDAIILAISGQENNAPGLAVLRGRFTASRRKSAIMYQGVPLFPDPKNATATLAVLNDETAIVGPTAELRAAIDRRGKAPALDSALASRVAELMGRYDFWSVGRMPKGLSTPSPALKSLQSIDSFEFGATLRDGLQCRAEIHVRTPEDAAQLESSLKMFGTMVNSNPSPGGTRFDLHAERGRLELELFVPEAELERALQGQKESFANLLQKGIGARLGTGEAKAVMPTPPYPKQSPASHTPNSLGTIVTNKRGETINVTLPGTN